VMPFRDLSGLPEGKLLAEGMSELVASQLAEANELRVTTSAEDVADLAAVRRRTGADAVIRGGVQRAGDRVRVTWSMVDTRGGARIDGQSVTGSAKDLFALEDDVAQSVLRVLRTPVAQVQSVAPRVTLSPEAQETFVEVYGMVRRPRDEKSLDSAIARLQGLLRDHRDSAPVNALLARGLLNKALLSWRPPLVEQAAVYARRAVALDPLDADAASILGSVQIAMGQHEQALKSFDRVLQLRAPRADVYVGRGDALQALGRGAEAEKAYLKALELKPDDANTFNKYGLFCLARGQAELAAKQFERSIALNADVAHVHLNLGSAYYALGRHDAAMTAFERSNAIAPNAGAYQNIGTIHFYKGRYDEACRAYERGVKLSPSDYLAWANLGDAYRWSPSRRNEANAMYAKAIELAREAVQVNPRDVVSRTVIAMAHAKRGELAPARSEMDRVLEMNPMDAVALYNSGVLALMENRRDSALSWLERAVASGYPAGDLMVDPELRALHEDPTFRAIVARKETS
jgi:tetratricopeptide (TPR) repeat protein/TolB-like protein